MMMSPTSELTSEPNAAPMMTPTARSTTLPFIANSRNSLSTCCPFASSSKYRKAHGGGAGRSVDQSRMHHGVANHLARRRRHGHQRQAHRFIESAEQLEAMLGAGEARLLENGIMQRSQPV